MDSQEITLRLTVQEVDFIGTVLGQVPTATTMQRGMLHLMPRLQEQAQASLKARAVQDDLIEQELAGALPNDPNVR